jgi:hypothetical protein
VLESAPSTREQATIGDIGRTAGRVIKRAFWPLVICLAAEAIYLAVYDRPGAAAFALVSVSSVIALRWWAESGEGLPIIPLLTLENLLIYGLPIALGDETVAHSSSDSLLSAGREVFLNNIAMIACWRIALQFVSRQSGLCFALQGINERSPRLAKLGLALLISSTAYSVLQSAGLLNFILDLLPAGSSSITSVLVSAASASGFFLTGILIGRGDLKAQGKAIFWAMLVIQSIITSAAFLLSASVTAVLASAIGLFWGSGRVPWRLVVAAVSVFAFLNLGKFTMRDRYWHMTSDDPTPDVTLTDMPRIYGEWIGASFDAITQQKQMGAQTAFTSFDQATEAKSVETQTLFARINNMQNLLYVIDAMDSRHLAPLGGATYTLIPPLLVPRILWPDKPRTHEGQVLLNVYFGRQDLHSTFQTYIAWGLLPEAYGNFGPVAGALALGAFCGLIFGWLERYVDRKVLLSTEGFLSFTLFLGIANSFEMVASVLVTSIFQACIPVIVASAPFVERMKPRSAPSVTTET